jgi:hypothetical protein
MTKVNYFRVNGKIKGKEDKTYRYARSKTEASEIAKQKLGMDIGELKTSVTEMKLSEMLAIMKPADLYNLRVEDKKLWKVNTVKQAAKKGN